MKILISHLHHSTKPFLGKVFMIITLIGLFHVQTTLTYAQPQSLKVIAYNIWNGFDDGVDKARHALFIEWAQEQNADVMALQELRSYTAEQLQEDAQKWGHPYAIILKEDGYPVGITSRKPIQLIEKVRDEMWHGMLHVKTYDIDFFVVHLSPADFAIRMREAEIISQKVKAIDHEKFFILGDFNAHSPMDADLDALNGTFLKITRERDANNKQHNNLRDGEFDYSVISTFLAIPSIDICHRKMAIPDRYSFPAPVVVGKYYYNDINVLKNTHRRIDYILASPWLAQQCQTATIEHSYHTDRISDHYPVIATFEWE